MKNALEVYLSLSFTHTHTHTLSLSLSPKQDIHSLSQWDHITPIFMHGTRNEDTFLGWWELYIIINLFKNVRKSKRKQNIYLLTYFCDIGTHLVPCVSKSLTFTDICSKIIIYLDLCSIKLKFMKH